MNGCSAISIQEHGAHCDDFTAKGRGRPRPPRLPAPPTLAWVPQAPAPAPPVPPLPQPRQPGSAAVSGLHFPLACSSFVKRAKEGVFSQKLSSHSYCDRRVRCSPAHHVDTDMHTCTHTHTQRPGVQPVVPTRAGCAAVSGPWPPSQVSVRADLTGTRGS